MQSRADSRADAGRRLAPAACAAVVALACALASALAATTARAGVDFGKHPGLQDLPYSCSKEIGKEVAYELGYARGAALAEVQRTSRHEALVVVNEERLYRLPPAVVALELFGACGRVREEVSDMPEPHLTFDADCWAASTLRRLGYWSRADFEEVVGWFLKGERAKTTGVSDGPSPGARAKNLYGCAR